MRAFPRILTRVSSAMAAFELKTWMNAASKLFNASDDELLFAKLYKVCRNLTLQLDSARFAIGDTESALSNNADSLEVSWRHYRLD